MNVRCCSLITSRLDRGLPKSRLMLITSSPVLTDEACRLARHEEAERPRRRMKCLYDTERNRCCLCCRCVCDARSPLSNLHNEKWLSALLCAAERRTCGGELQISLHKCFPLLLE